MLVRSSPAETPREHQADGTREARLPMPTRNSTPDREARPVPARSSAPARHPRRFRAALRSWSYGVLSKTCTLDARGILPESDADPWPAEVEAGRCYGVGRNAATSCELHLTRLMPGAAASHPAEVRCADELTSRERVQTLEELQPGCFSACTCTVRDRHVIVYSPLASVAGRRVTPRTRSPTFVLQHSRTSVHTQSAV
jgi:hypothetical protein